MEPDTRTYLHTLTGHNMVVSWQSMEVGWRVKLQATIHTIHVILIYLWKVLIHHSNRYGAIEREHAEVPIYSDRIISCQNMEARLSVRVTL